MTDQRDSVYQHLLRTLREETAETLGACVHTEPKTGLEILSAAVTQATFELEVVADRLETLEPNGSPLEFLVRAIIKRLEFAEQLTSGVWNPDDPYQTASSIEYHPDGIDAGIQAAKESSARLRRRRAEEAGRPLLAIVKARPTMRDFPGLLEQEANADKTAELLERAARQVTALVPGETWGEQAARLLQAATYAGVAVAELQRSVGWYEAAAAASEAGVLNGEERDDG